MTSVSTLTFLEARACVLERVKAARPAPAVEEVGIDCAAGRVLARDALADRDYPPLDRSVRDGFAVRSSDTPGEVRVIGQVRAGEISSLEIGPSEAIEIMTGAPVPRGADAIVMVEHVTRDGDRISVPKAKPAQFINPQGCEARDGAVAIPAGKRLDYSGVALLATIGIT